MLEEGTGLVHLPTIKRKIRKEKNLFLNSMSDFPEVVIVVIAVQRMSAAELFVTLKLQTIET